MELAALRQYERQIEEACPFPPPEVELSFRHMFGALGAYVRGRIFCFVTSEGLAVKLDDYGQGELREDAPDARNLSWTTKYLIAPPAVVDDPAQLSDWLGRSIEYVLSLPPEKKGKGRR
jgi:TfoX/Sxy family transcriptional regulator of competence genes